MAFLCGCIVLGIGMTGILVVITGAVGPSGAADSVDGLAQGWNHGSMNALLIFCSILIVGAIVIWLIALWQWGEARQ